MSERSAQTYAAIDMLSRAVGVDPWGLRLLAMHESSGDYLVTHESGPDRRANVHAWQSEAKRYAQNPYYRDAARWAVGRGPYGMVVAYHLYRWSADADPLALHDPVIATVVALRLIGKIVRERARTGRKTTWADVMRLWKWGSTTPTNATPEQIAATDAGWRSYATKHGHPKIPDTEIAIDVSPIGRDGDTSETPAIRDAYTMATSLAPIQGKRAPSSGGSGIGLALIVALALASTCGAAVLIARAR